MATNHASTEPQKQPVPSQPALSWTWVLQRFTAILLVVFLGGHLWVEHFMNTNVAVVTERLRNGIFVVLDTGLLVTVVYHGLNGLHGIVKETWEWARSRWVLYFLLVLGLVTGFWGMDILWAFLYHHPFLVIG